MADLSPAHAGHIPPSPPFYLYPPHICIMPFSALLFHYITILCKQSQQRRTQLSNLQYSYLNHQNLNSTPQFDLVRRTNENLTKKKQNKSDHVLFELIVHCQLALVEIVTSVCGIMHYSPLGLFTLNSIFPFMCYYYNKSVYNNRKNDLFEFFF